MEIRDTIQSDDIRCDGWIDKDTAEASIRQTEATLKRYTPVYDAQCKEYPRGVEPQRRTGAHPDGARAGNNGPSASLRDDSDNGSCPAMPMRGGAGKRSGAPGAAAERISLRPFG